MKNIKIALVVALVLQSLSGVALLTRTADVVAQDKPKNTQPSTGSVLQASSEISYKYVAQNGDSYTKMARKAIQTYGIKNKVKLSPAKIIFAETNLTDVAGSPYLDLGQSVAIKESTVKSWVEKAKILNASQEAAWNYYVQFVNFNTNAVGEAK